MASATDVLMSVVGHPNTSKEKRDQPTSSSKYLGHNNRAKQGNRVPQREPIVQSHEKAVKDSRDGIRRIKGFGNPIKDKSHKVKRKSLNFTDKYAEESNQNEDCADQPIDRTAEAEPMRPFRHIWCFPVDVFVFFVNRHGGSRRQIGLDMFIYRPPWISWDQKAMVDGDISIFRVKGSDPLFYVQKWWCGKI